MRTFHRHTDSGGGEFSSVDFYDPTRALMKVLDTLHERDYPNVPLYLADEWLPSRNTAHSKITSQGNEPIIPGLEFGSSLPYATRDEVLAKLRVHNLHEHADVLGALRLLSRYCWSDKRDNGMSYLEQHIFPVTLDYVQFCEVMGTKIESDDIVIYLLHDLMEKYIKTSEDRVNMRSGFSNLYNDRVATCLSDVSKPLEAKLDPPENFTVKEAKLWKRAAIMRLYAEIMEGSEHNAFLFVLKTFDRINNIRCSICNANWSYNGDLVKLDHQMEEAREFLSPRILRFTEFPSELLGAFNQVLVAGDRLLAEAKRKRLYTPETAAA